MYCSAFALLEANCLIREPTSARNERSTLNSAMSEVAEVIIDALHSVDKHKSQPSSGSAAGLSAVQR
jgi:hypothetical protein